MNGEFIPASQASVDICDAGIVSGVTVTEMIRTFAHVPFRLEDHVARFFRSCKYARLNCPVSPEELVALSREIIRRNSTYISAEGELSLVFFITPGINKIYAGFVEPTGDTRPTLCIHTMPLRLHFWAHYYSEGCHVITPSIRHIPPQCLDPKIKCRSRMHFWLARQEVQLVDPKAVALCLDLDGNVTETPGSNFLIVKDGVVISPSRRNILPGISLATIRDICAELGISFVEQDFQVYDVINADEAILASTPYSLAPVTLINGIAIGAGSIQGPIFRRIVAAWNRMVGLDILEQIMKSDANPVNVGT
jgi:branched-subunit amino acid aminotransferase/4-amino-4-deoxychorismate lyase